VQLHPIVVWKRPHEAAHRHYKPRLVERDEANHIPRMRGQLLIPRGEPLMGRPEGAGVKQPPSTKPYRSSSVTEEKEHGSRRARTLRFSAMAKERGSRDREPGLFSLFSSQCATLGYDLKKQRRLGLGRQMQGKNREGPPPGCKYRDQQTH
jgi:hypothetical protein